jgi:steroid 5-alpha reductase family enzyme
MVVVLAAAAAAIIVLVVGTWFVSVRIADASIIDPMWPLLFVAAASVAFAAGDGTAARRGLLLGLTAVWGLRLSAHLFRRHHGAGEDFRYVLMRRKQGDAFARWSLTHVFLLQGVLAWIVALPLTTSAGSDRDLGPVAVVGVVIWVVGFAFESVGDAQLTRFKADPANAGRVLDTGLWRYTRHPNYFGDACVWWGIALVAAETGIGAIGIVGAVVMNVLLRRVSGVPMLERGMAKRRPGYDEYVARTSPFFPRPPARDR